MQQERKVDAARRTEEFDQARNEHKSGVKDHDKRDSIRTKSLLRIKARENIKDMITQNLYDSPDIVIKRK